MRKSVSDWHNSEKIKRSIFVVEGSVNVDAALDTHQLTTGGYAFFPANSPHSIRATDAARLNVFEKPYSTLPSVDAPPIVVGHEQDVETIAYLGDPDLLLTTLLPNTPAFDMAVNIMHYNPGATLPIYSSRKVTLTLVGSAHYGSWQCGTELF